MVHIFDTPVGKITLVASEGAIVGLYFGIDTNKFPDSMIEKNKNNSDPVLELCKKELAGYFAGELQKFTMPVKVEGTPFRMKVWDALRNIPYGEVASYLEIAKAIGNPKAVRAVGGANHNNPVSIIIPCHRVVGSDGSLVGYGGGLETKQFLLDLESRFKK